MHSFNLLFPRPDPPEEPSKEKEPEEQKPAFVSRLLSKFKSENNKETAIDRNRNGGNDVDKEKETKKIVSDPSSEDESEEQAIRVKKPKKQVIFHIFMELLSYVLLWQFIIIRLILLMLDICQSS